MKNLKKLTLLIIAVLLIGLSGYSQKQTTKDTLSAGDELVISSNHYYTGLILTTLSAGIVIVASTIKPNYTSIGTDNNEDLRQIIYGVGCAVALTGIGYLIESKIHVKRAGLLLNENGIGLSIKINK